MSFIVRLTDIEIDGFKNVRHGEISFSDSESSSVVGIYGQNGSGKTALIDALAFLKSALSGEALSKHAADYINIDSEYALLRFGFLLSDSDVKQSISYEFKVARAKIAGVPTVVIFDERLSYDAECATGKRKMLTLIDTGRGAIFGPASKLDLLTNKSKEAKTDLLVAKKLAAAGSRSFIFSDGFLEIISKYCADKKVLTILESLSHYGKTELFIITSANIGMVSLNALPLTFKYRQTKDITGIGNIAIPLNDSVVVSQNIYTMVVDVIKDMNVVLNKIVPGMTVGVKNLGTILSPSVDTAVRIQLTTRKNVKEIPLQYESDGIKRIVSILHLLIVMYNTPSFTVAVDDLDEGMFEYLFGELLSIIQDYGLGQLIFTSHNLRPLETIDRRSIIFTTANPKNRYIHLANIKTNNNLRDLYYREIVLGGYQKENLYIPTDNSEIALAFHEAGGQSKS